MEKDDKGSTMIRMGVSGWMFLLVPAYPGCPGSKAVKRSLLLLLLYGVVSSVLNMMNSVNCRELYPDLQSNLAEFRQHLIDSTADMAPLRVWQLQGTHMWHPPVISAASVYHWWKRSNATSLRNQLVDDEKMTLPWLEPRKVFTREDLLWHLTTWYWLGKWQ